MSSTCLYPVCRNRPSVLLKLFNEHLLVVRSQRKIGEAWPGGKFVG